MIDTFLFDIWAILSFLLWRILPLETLCFSFLSISILNDGYIFFKKTNIKWYSTKILNEYLWAEYLQKFYRISHIFSLASPNVNILHTHETNSDPG